MIRFVIAMMIALPAHAGIFDIIKGHANDIQSRFTADEVIGSYDNVIREGQIRENDPGQDFLHNASGTVQLRFVGGKWYIQLDKDFTSSPGPDYHVYVSSSSNISDEPTFYRSEQIELGRLIKGKGASYYEVSGITPADIQSVTIWCKQFGEFIGSADL